MKARIVEMNRKRGFYIFEINGEYGYFELLDTTELEVDDVLSGDFSCLGGTEVKLLSTGERINIYIQDFCSLSHARNIIK